MRRLNPMYFCLKAAADCNTWLHWKRDRSTPMSVYLFAIRLVQIMLFWAHELPRSVQREQSIRLDPECVLDYPSPPKN